MSTVCVLGGGVVGTTTAVVLAEGGARVALVTADPPAATTSTIAAGAWHPTLVGPRDAVLRWGARTVEVLGTIADRYPQAGVLHRWTLDLTRDPDPPRPWWAAAVPGLRRARDDELRPGYAAGWVYRVPLAVTPRYLPWLRDHAVERGVRIVPQRVGSFVEAAQVATAALGVPTTTVVDCAGLAARDLVDDPELHAVRGQLVRTTDPGLTWSLRDLAHPDGATYVHPRGDDVVLGGTSEPDVEDRTPDPDVAAAILGRARELEPALTRARVLGHQVGLRPARPRVRCEVDPDPPAGVTLLHHYGHGGAGITCSWGSAEQLRRRWEGTR